MSGVSPTTPFSLWLTVRTCSGLGGGTGGDEEDHMKRMTMIGVAIFTTQGVIGGGAVASPAHPYQTTVVSGPSMLAAGDTEVGGCASDPLDDALFPRTPGLDSESTLAVDPRDPLRKVAVWLADDGFLIGTATTLDGGREWTREVLPGVTTCSGGIHRVTFDSRVVIGTDENVSSLAYAVSTSQNQPAEDLRGGISHISVSTKSLDGSGWSRPVVVDASPSNDYPVIAVDPRRSGTAYVVWSKRLDATMFSATYDGGKTWTSPKLVRVSAPGTVGLNEIVVGADGQILNLFAEIEMTSQPSTATLYLSESADGGVTWSPKETVGSDITVPGLALAESNGDVYASWTREDENGHQVVVAKRDSGEWAPATPVSRGANDTHPGLDVMDDGTVGLTFYETRPTSDGRSETYVVIAHSEDGGVTWERTDASGPFDREKFPPELDHSTIVATPCGFETTWTAGSDIAHYGGSDVFWSSVGLATAPQGPCRGAASP